MNDISDFGAMALQNVMGAEMARSLGTHYDTLFRQTGLTAVRGPNGVTAPPGAPFINILGDEILIQRLAVGPRILANEMKRRTKAVANKYFKPEIQARIPIRKNKSHRKSERRLKRKGERATWGGRGVANSLTGKLRKSVGVSTHLETVTIWVGGNRGKYNLFYGAVLEHGTKKGGGNPRGTTRFIGFNFVERGIAAAWPRYERAIREEVNDFIGWMCRQQGGYGAYGKQGSVNDFAIATRKMVSASRGSPSGLGIETQALSMF